MLTNFEDLRVQEAFSIATHIKRSGSNTEPLGQYCDHGIIQLAKKGEETSNYGPCRLHLVFIWLWIYLHIAHITDANKIEGGTRSLKRCKIKNKSHMSNPVSPLCWNGGWLHCNRRTDGKFYLGMCRSHLNSDIRRECLHKQERVSYIIIDSNIISVNRNSDIYCRTSGYSACIHR